MPSLVTLPTDLNLCVAYHSLPESFRSEEPASIKAFEALKDYHFGFLEM